MEFLDPNQSRTVFSTADRLAAERLRSFRTVGMRDGHEALRIECARPKECYFQLRLKSRVPRASRVRDKCDEGAIFISCGNA